LFGAQAIAIYGVQRTTADLDITIALGDRSLAELVKPLARAGFSARFADPDFAAATRVFPIVHDATGWPIDLVLAGPGLEELFLDSAQIHVIERRRIPVIAPEHLVVTKLLAQRPKDLEDIRGLLRVATIDHREVERLLAALEDALGQRDLRPLYATLVASAPRPRPA
jgi:hypothetical protein